MSTNPNTVKSQDDLPTTNDGKRSSDVLLSTIEELERTKKQLDIAVKRLKFLKTKTSSPYYGNDTYLKTIYQMRDKTLRQIERLNK